MVSMATGVVYWLIGLLIIRQWGGYLTAEHGLQALLLYGLIVPVNALLFIIPVKLGELYNTDNQPESYDAIVIVSLVGCFLDVICVNFVPTVYQQPMPIVALGLTWLLWGIGSGLLGAYLAKDTNVIPVKQRPQKPVTINQ